MEWVRRCAIGVAFGMFVRRLTATAKHAKQSVPERIRRVESVLRQRTSRVLLVLEASIDEHNQQAVVRTAEAFGVQHVWILRASEKEMKKREMENARRVSKAAAKWVSVRMFTSLDVLIRELKADNRAIWAADVSPDAVPLTLNAPLQVPERLAIVIGRECDGVSPKMLSACCQKVYVPMHGFAESFNLGVASGLVLQRLFDLCPQARGDMAAEERNQLRREWMDEMCAPAEVVECCAQNDFQTLSDMRRQEKAVRVPSNFKH
eukprot:TRINITY_DN60776_c0_g1_i2.p1 TRINITY_DN60776_c0_g1~~TRINITY_DN60776_c0_g1_i2.p1  ORF type:complete len:263 (+),score=62.51 TRINITY_DN60776_c0_g1_i2:174-962(+)